MYWKDYINSILPKPREKCNEGTWTEVKSQKQEKVDKLKYAIYIITGKVIEKHIYFPNKSV